MKKIENTKLNIKEKIKLIAARDNPNISKSTFLQLILLFFSCSKSCSLDKDSEIILLSHTNDSVKKPCSIPK